MHRLVLCILLAGTATALADAHALLPIERISHDCVGHPLVRTALLLTASNIFMTFAWYGHLKHLNGKPWWIAALAGRGMSTWRGKGPLGGWHRPLLVCLALAACSPDTERAAGTADAYSTRATTQQAPAATSAVPSAVPRARSSGAPIAPLNVPERVISGQVTESRGTWNEAVQRITYRSSADDTRQPMMFYKPQIDEPRPLLVALHSWSADYRQRESAIYAEWSVANGWVFIHPQFRGPSVRPEATGSELVIRDVLSAIEYAKQNARVDERRIYAVGWSGGGHLALLLAARAPQIWAGVSAWAPIPDLNAWYQESKSLGTKYAPQIAASCGGAPTGRTKAAEECRKRSPITQLEHARGVAIDINHGIRDGHGGASVPMSQSLRAFNLLAERQDRFTEEEVEYFTREARVPPHRRSETPAPSSGGLHILFRRQSGNARITVFDGAHAKNTEDALRWLNEQIKS